MSLFAPLVFTTCIHFKQQITPDFITSRENLTSLDCGNLLLMIKYFAGLGSDLIQLKKIEN